MGYVGSMKGFKASLSEERTRVNPFQKVQKMTTVKPLEIKRERKRGEGEEGMRERMSSRESVQAKK